MYRAIFTGVAVVSLLVSSSANAQAPINWSGLYVGGNAGYAWSRTTGTDLGDGTGVSWRNLGEHFSNKANGFTGGLQVGANRQVGLWLWGIEADVGYLGLKGRGQWDVYPDFIETDASIAATFRGRLGVVSNHALFYFTGGAIAADLNNKVRLNNSMWVTNSTGVQWGWTVGAGVEWALNTRWSLKTEYLYYSFGKENVIGGQCGGGECNFGTETAGSLVRVGLNYRFSNY